MRSQSKADKIKEAHPNCGKDKLDFAIVEDIAQEGAFDQAIKSDPPFEAVVHTASPFHFNVTDVQKQLLDPAYIGTTGILKSIQKSAPSVKRVVITSSFAAVVNPHKGTWPEHTYSEADWNPLTHKEALENPMNGYRASKTFAEKAAWDFLEKEKPNWTLATMNPPMVFGPVVHYLNSLDAMNTSNERFRNIIQGKAKEEIPPTGMHIWIDVRDLALAHVKAMELEEAANKRFFLTEGYYSNKQIVDIIRKHFPEYKDVLPAEGTSGGDFPDGFPETYFKIDNSRSKKVLGLQYRPFEDCVVDTIKSFKSVGA